jgi:hypothetical protein
MFSCINLICNSINTGFQLNTIRENPICSTVGDTEILTALRFARPFAAAILFQYISNKMQRYTVYFIWKLLCCTWFGWYTLFNKNQAAWYVVRPAQAVTWRTVAIIIPVVLVSPYLSLSGVSLSSIHYKQSRRVYINQRHQYICLIWS